MISYAQNLEDVVLNRAFQNKPTGFYIDVGAHDPVELSVTKHFYNIGWRGINIEPVPKSYKKFETNRPEDINLNIAIGVKHDFFSIYEIDDHPEFTSLNKKNAETAGKLTGSKVIKYKIETRTLKEVCDQYCDSFIDFIKIDVEGFEKEVIRGADFSKYRPTMIVVEAMNPCKAVIEDWENPEAEAAWHDWEPLLFESEYLLAYYDGLNRYYLRKEDEHLKKYYEIPITLIQDNFSIYSAVKEIDILKSNSNELEKKNRKLNEQFENATEKCSNLLDNCKNKDLKFARLSKENIRLIKENKNKQNLINEKINDNNNLKNENRHIKSEFGDTKKECKSLNASLADKELILKQAIKDNEKLKDENQHIKSEFGDTKKECKSLNASLADKELILKQAIKDNEKLKDENQHIKSEFGDTKKECKSLNASLADKELNLKQAIKDNNKLNNQYQNIAIENRQILNEFRKIKKEYEVLTACIKQKDLHLKQKKWLKPFEHISMFFDLKENFKKNKFNINIKKQNRVSNTEITKNTNRKFFINFPPIFFQNWDMVSSVIRNEIVKKGYNLALETEKFFQLKFLFPKTEWIGICHFPFELPNWLIKTKAYISYAKWRTSNEAWIDARTNCKGLIAFSKDHSEKIQSKTGIKTNVIKIPNYEISEKWTWEAFESNTEQKIVQVGWWLMRMNAIHCFPDSVYKKIWIHNSDSHTDDVFNKERKYLKERNLFFNFMEESVAVYNHLTGKEYAEIMCSNIAFIHYYDVSAPDFVIECIARNTPILVNPLPAVREYLGDEYPLYYYFYNDAVAKAENQKLVKHAHEYLCQLAKKMELSPSGIATQIRNYLKDVE